MMKASLLHGVPLFLLEIMKKEERKGILFLAPLKMRRFLSASSAKVCCYHQR